MTVSTEKASMYLVAIVGIVAAVGIVVLLIESGMSFSQTDYSGEAIRVGG